MRISRLFLAALFLLPAAAFADETQGLRYITTLNQYPNDGYSAIWGYTAPDGREYALLGVQTGTSIVDITDEANIHEVAFIPGPKTEWRELKAYSHYAYVVTDNAAGGIQIVDLAELPAKATLVNTFMDLPENHTVWVDEPSKTLFTMGGTMEKINALSLADPVNLKMITTFGTTYVHDAYISNGIAYLSEIFSKSFSIWDIKDLANPKMLNRVRDDTAGGISFHNSGLTQDGNYLITTEEATGRTVKIWDVRDPANVTKVSEFMTSNKMAHNVQVMGDYAYFSAYGGGIIIEDVKDPKNPKLAAYWHHDDGTQEGFVSVWGCFPYFKSGKVIGSDMEAGLVVVQFKPQKVQKKK
jgi:choice-of-anchor B domain-containing protein